MHRPMRVHTVNWCKIAYLLVLALLIGVSIAALLDALFDRGWGLGWTVFFVGFIVSAWATVAYPVCGSCCGWDRTQH